ncbi:MAG: YeeE/YedE family protein [Alphaproteobacteria bacterium]|nr:YeeE/YedE family protein [Alphaproteobacteria bacterium]MBO6861224.1 YeeE/YedE family protein [Alphaproteobacteria bacterium]
MNGQVLIAGLSGLLFGIGLAVSEMVNPARVPGFLDLLGDWDPTLAFVMAGALGPMALAWLIARRRGDRTLTGGKIHRPTAKHIDVRLVVGAVLFGIGWGLVGLCPGPAVASLGIAGSPAWIFFAALVAGMALHRLLPRPG